MLKKNILVYVFCIIGTFVFFVPFASAENCVLKKQKTYKSSNSSAVWFVTEFCTKRAFSRDFIFKTYEKDYSAVATVPQYQLDSIPNDGLGFMPLGPLYDPKYGALVKTVYDPRVYLLLGSQKYWITEENIFTALGYSWNWIEDIDQRLLNKYYTGSEISFTDHHPNYTLVKYKNNPKVYRIQPDPNDPNKQVKRWIKNETEFNILGFRWDRIVEIGNNETYKDSELPESEDVLGVPTNQICTDAECLNKSINYLIITRPLFSKSSELQEFIKWKKESFNVGLLTVEWIDTKFSGKNLTEKIKSAIHNKYGGQKTKYVLLVGDTQVNLPDDYDKGWYEPSEMYNLSQDWNVPTGAFMGGPWIQFADLYYADAEDLHINNEGHPEVGIPNDYYDFEVIVGRFPVRIPHEIEIIMKKSKAMKPASNVLSIISSEDFELTEDPCTKWPPDEFTETYEGTSCYTSHPYSLQRAVEGSNVFYTNYFKNFSDDKENTEARDLIFNSTSIIDGIIHGAHSANEAFSYLDVPLFKNIFPLYAVSSCLSNAFHQDEKDSLAEVMLKNEKGPAVVMGVVNSYNFYTKALSGATVGEAKFNLGKKLYRGDLILQDLMGDPSLKIF